MVLGEPDSSQSVVYYGAVSIFFGDLGARGGPGSEVTNLEEIASKNKSFSGSFELTNPWHLKKKPFCAVCEKRPNKKNTEVFIFIFAKLLFLCLETTRTIAAASLTLRSTCNERPGERKRWRRSDERCFFSVSEALHFVSRHFISVRAEADSRRAWHNTAGQTDPV